MMWTITATQNEAAWEEDYYRQVIAHSPPPLPPNDQQFGRIESHWHQVEAGIAFVSTNPETGSYDDRRLIEAVVMAQLRPHGYKRAVYTPGSEAMRKTANWDEVQAKAKRLIQQGKVMLLRNSANTIVAEVQGDHGTYQPEISRDDPNSSSISGSQCQCDWGNFQNQPRTRVWKKYQDRPCAHILAAYWQSLATPLDEERNPGAYGPGQMALPGMDAIGPTGAPQSMPLMQQSPSAPAPGQQAPLPGLGPQGPQMPAGAPTDPSQVPGTPSPTDILPQFIDPTLAMPHNPASVPGLRQPSPTDPIQYPGGTFSSWHGATLQHMSDDGYQLQNGDLVQLNHDDDGAILQGRSPEHGAGQQTSIKAGQVGEVLGTHPLTKMVNVLYMGKPWDQNGIMMPYGATCWHWPSSLTPRPDLRKPGPAIRRK